MEEPLILERHREQLGGWTSSALEKIVEPLENHWGQEWDKKEWVEMKLSRWERDCAGN
jgi:hypothetical protein